MVLRHAHGGQCPRADIIVWTSFEPQWSPLGDLTVQRRRMRRIAHRLASAYPTPDFGNLEDPLAEAVFILLTYQTTVERARRTYAALRSAFPDWGQLVTAAPGQLENILRPSGFQRNRARLLCRLLEDVRMRFGSYDLSALRELSRDAAETELRRLPGIDIKGARCVLLYSLGMHVLPVDSNTFRIMKRLGVLTPSSKFRRKELHDGLEQLVPPSCRLEFHLNLVAHGKQTCLPATPRCEACPLLRSCPTGKQPSELRH